jgi:hypothetical protein
MQNELAKQFDNMREDETARLCLALHLAEDPRYEYLKEIKSAQPRMAVPLIGPRNEKGGNFLPR